MNAEQREPTEIEHLWMDRVKDLEKENVQLKEDNERWVKRIKLLEARAIMAEAVLIGQWDPWVEKKTSGDV